MENLDSLLKKQASELKELSNLVRNDNPALEFNEKEYAKYMTDVKKEYSALYRARLNFLKPMIMAAAVKKWAPASHNFNQTLISIRPGVFLLNTIKI